MLAEFIITFILLITLSGIFLFLFPLRISSLPVKEKSHKSAVRYENKHLDRIGKEVIKHPEPEKGYVVLNGVKRKIKDCKDL